MAPGKAGARPPSTKGDLVGLSPPLLNFSLALENLRGKWNRKDPWSCLLSLLSAPGIQLPICT